MKKTLFTFLVFGAGFVVNASLMSPLQRTLLQARQALALESQVQDAQTKNALLGAKNSLMKAIADGERARVGGNQVVAAQNIQQIVDRIKEIVQKGVSAPVNGQAQNLMEKKRIRA